jgi:hypothetical protein
MNRTRQGARLTEDGALGSLAAFLAEDGSRVVDGSQEHVEDGSLVLVESFLHFPELSLMTSPQRCSAFPIQGPIQVRLDQKEGYQVQVEALTRSFRNSWGQLVVSSCQQGVVS